MNTISINLLPTEIRQSKEFQEKKALLIRSAIITLIVSIGIAAVVLVLAIGQNLSLRLAQENLNQIKSRLISFKEPEGLAFTLKSRLTDISKIYGRDSQHSQTFNLITALMPAEVRLINFSIARGNQVNVEGETASTASLETFFDNLTDPANAEGIIVSSKVDSLSRGQTDRVRFDLTIVTTGK